MKETYETLKRLTLLAGIQTVGLTVDTDSTELSVHVRFTDNTTSVLNIDSNTLSVETWQGFSDHVVKQLAELASKVNTYTKH